MNTKVLCTWLELPNWPPDHYALLGLKPGESDSARLEQNVHERMTRLRCYQLSHPEEATEGMNRLAQAFICVSETLAKVPCAKCEPSTKKASDDTLTHLVADGKTEVDWKSTPPPVRGVPVRAKTDSGQMRVVVPPNVEATSPSGQFKKPASAQDFSAASKGLDTLRALIERINVTRKLLHAWRRIGKYLRVAERKLQAAEEADLTRRLSRIFELMGEFPPLIGHPGRPGYRVVAMARLEMTPGMLRTLDGPQRAWLASDWQAAFQLLLDYRQFLRAEFKRLRGQNVVQVALAAVQRPAWVIGTSFAVIGLGILACILVYLCILFYRTLS